MLRRRRRRRRVGLALAAGVAGLLLLLGPASPPAPDGTAGLPARPPDGPQATLPPVPAADPDAGLSAAAWEWRALDSPARRYALYCRAGDRYLFNDADPESALRCYRNALDAATDDELAVHAEDSWLLITLKDARLQEKAHVAKGG
jgi:hypothetical protein